MNKKILGIFVSLLVVAMLATPVMAAAKTKFEVLEFGGLMDEIAPTEVRVAGRMKQGTGGILTSAPGHDFGIIWDYSDIYTWLIGSGVLTYDYRVNTDNGRGVVNWDTLLTFDDGTFEGNIIQHSKFDITGDRPLQTSGFGNGVLFGTGDYVDWRLDITIEGDFATIQVDLTKPST